MKKRAPKVSRATDAQGIARLLTMPNDGPHQVTFELFRCRRLRSRRVRMMWRSEDGNLQQRWIDLASIYTSLASMNEEAVATSVSMLVMKATQDERLVDHFVQDGTKIKVVKRKRR